MAASPNSYKDPAYSAIEARVEREVGLPSGMLATIRTRGERSNADQVSEAGARSVYQIIPTTRSSIQKNYGFDPYAGPEQAARGAAVLLKESLDRNNGNRAAAFREYHGGTNPANYGPRTRAYVQRTTGGGDPASTGGYDPLPKIPTYQRRTPQNAGPDPSQYPDIRAVANSPLRKVEPIPPEVLASYNSHKMSDEDRAGVDQLVKDGVWAVPRGQHLQKPAPRTVGDRLGMGTRTILENAGRLVDVVAGPVNYLANAVNSGMNYLAGTPQDMGRQSVTPGLDIGRSASDAAGFAKPESDTENMNDAVIGGATQGLLTAGAGLAAAPLEGAAGIVGKTLAASPLLDTISGATSGASQETARQAGAGPVGQVAAGLAGGFLPVGAASATSRIRAPKSLPEVVETVPRAAVVDEAGNLTPEGQEIAARHNVTPEEVVRAYEAPPKVQEATANDQMPEATARQVNKAEPIVEPAPTQEAPAAQGEPSELPPQPNAPNTDQPNPVPEALPATALARVEAGKELGVDMTRGQATKSFDVQDAESRLRNSNGPEGEQMRQFVAKQTEQVKTAVDEFKSAFDDANMSAEQRGQAVQEAIRELRDNGQKGVTALYKTARELGQEVPLDTTGISRTFEGLMAEADIPESVKKVMEQEAARYGLIGKAQVIDDATGAVTNEAGVTTVKLDDGQTIKFRGEPQTLRLDNAEQFRQVISKQYPVDGPQKLTQELKTAIDNATEEAATKLAQYGQEGAKVPNALKAAREAHVEQVKTFKAKDIVQSIADWKKGTNTDVLKPEQVMQQALAKTSDLKRIKAVLLSKPTVQSKAAWRAIQAHGLAEIFSKATTRNANVGGEITEAISGAKLRSAIESFGADKLKVLLDPDDFNKLMKLRRVIEDVTIPITGTTNPSGSGNLLMRLAKDVDNQVTAAFSAAGMALGGPAGAAIGGAAGRTLGPAVKDIKQARVNAETLKGATEYTPEVAAGDTGAKAPSAAAKAGSAVKQAGASSVKAFIETYGSPRILAPVLASTLGSQPEPARGAGTSDPYAEFPIVRNADKSRWDKREDGSDKGEGWLGLRQRPDGNVSSEISVGTEIRGKEVEIPLMVPGLSKAELTYLMTNEPDQEKNPDFIKNMPRSILQKASAFAARRIAQGKSPFRQSTEPMMLTTGAEQ